MNDYLEYRGYIGTIQFSKEDNIYYGEVLVLENLISYEGETLELLKEDFIDAVDCYLDICKITGSIPEPPMTYKDHFLKKFPNASQNDKGYPLLCRKAIYGGGYSDDCDYNCEKCWDDKYKGESMI